MSSVGGRPRVPTAQEKVVISRSGNRCAFPACGRRLVFDAIGPKDQDKAIGKVAHICAASVGGARYDSAMSDKDRGSASNLIYLCGDHHDAVDAQTGHYTREFLENAKRDHEAKSDRAMAYAVGELGFAQLEMVCNFMAGLGEQAGDDEAPSTPLDVKRKIERNGLGDRPEMLLATALAATGQVARYIDFASQMKPDFARRLGAFFQARYQSGVADGLAGDDLFDFVVAHALDNAGPAMEDPTRAAALAVVAHMFEICEVFESDDSAA